MFFDIRIDSGCQICFELIRGSQVGVQIAGKFYGCAADFDYAANQSNAVRSKLVKVEGVPAFCAADVRLAAKFFTRRFKLIDGAAVEAEYVAPPVDVSSAITARNPP